jgi:hypothetical protein
MLEGAWGCVVKWYIYRFGWIYRHDNFRGICTIDNAVLVTVRRCQYFDNKMCTSTT